MVSGWTAGGRPGGGGVGSRRERVAGVMGRVAARGLDTMLVAHNGPLSTILMMLLEMPNSAVNRLWFEQGCWSCVELREGGKPRLLYFNK